MQDRGNIPTRYTPLIVGTFKVITNGATTKGRPWYTNGSKLGGTPDQQGSVGGVLLPMLTHVPVCGSVANGMRCLLNTPKMLMVH